ncbi:hypothetical protein L917_17692, partial [Phytophthora nicotianae]
MRGWACCPTAGALHLGMEGLSSGARPSREAAPEEMPVLW